MADGVFQSGGHLRESLRVTVGYEDRVVSETLPATGRLRNGSVHNPFEGIFLSVEYQCDDCPETGAAVGNPFEVVQQKPHVGFEVMAFRSVTRGVYARRTAQRRNFQTGIVGETVGTASRMDITHLLERIALDGGLFLRNLLRNTSLAQRDEPVTVAEDGFYLLQLMRIVCSEQNLSLHDVTLRTCGSL